MSRDNSPPFNRGEYAAAETDGSLSFVYLEGREYLFEDTDPRATSGSAASRTGRMVRCRLVRNVSGGNLLPKRLVQFSTDAGRYGSRVSGYATTTAQEGVPVDEYLPAAGVPNNALFWVVVSGPALVLSDLAGGANNVITVGQRLVSLTAATSGATTAGRVAPIDLTGATTPLANQILNTIGQALTAKTTGNTNADVLVEIQRPHY
ncbi:MAG: hypothetical protein HC888_00775 [Candidatus Competibacteraceae bacterium]|nr:hypothetical protein [Candidatus Competibacteraceae bacterium]